MQTVILANTKHFRGKVNFVDSNNVILGYDLETSCCESTSWSISESMDGSNPLYHGDDQSEVEATLHGYGFDPTFFHKDSPEDEGGAAVFRLIRKSYQQPDRYLYVVLENHHNGYYSHGFVFRGDKVIEDCI